MGNQLDIPFDKIIDMGNTSKSDATLTPNIYSTSKPAVYTSTSCNERDEIQIFVQNIDGRTLTLSTAKNTSILDCKKSIFAKAGIDIDEQIIYYEGKELANNKTIYDYNINTESTINLSLGLKGGCFKCCCLEWTGCCIKCEWNGCCCCRCRDNYKCCCAKDACCLYPEAPCYCCPCAVCYCIKNSICGFCCGGGENRTCITEKINCCQCSCCSTE